MPALELLAEPLMTVRAAIDIEEMKHHDTRCHAPIALPLLTNHRSACAEHRERMLRATATPRRYRRSVCALSESDKRAPAPAVFSAHIAERRGAFTCYRREARQM